MERSSSTTCEYVGCSSGSCQRPFSLAVGLDERDAVLAAAGQAQVAERLLVDREEAARRAVLRRHVPDRGAVGERQAREPVAEVLDELPDDAGLAQDLRHREDEVGRGRALGQRAVEPEADDLRHEHRDRLAEHRRLGLDPADAPAEHAEAVDHRRVRVGADDRVGIRLAVALLDHAGEELEVDLVADAGVRRHRLEVVEGALAPAQERVALAVAAELELGVALDREPRREVVDLHGVVDHELDRDQRVDLLRVAAEVGHRGAHRGQVDDGGDAGEVLQQDAGGVVVDLLRRLGAGVPARDRLDVARGDGDAVLAAQHVLEQDAQRVRQPGDVVALLQRRDAEDLELAAADGEGGARAEGVGVGHPSIVGMSPTRKSVPPARRPDGHRFAVKLRIDRGRDGLEPAGAGRTNASDGKSQGGPNCSEPIRHDSGTASTRIRHSKTVRLST